ncbi:hypothetical protein [Allosediminivita pacifica]|uniref:Response regulatory domain-containing protein n=1 Tax=Allosediminivita pacifica TaxID=1267769 RepID=A0A2T6B9I4_9RHOB|nr:hypothetical protein [Allosediminivita pacifica]PTX52737.1 hypothetical protein C8N44_10126 [Allosediminivita pacifica]GGA96245.1 hypothetical protein GCM10011324_03170 [Allosediminivita pacifica]
MADNGSEGDGEVALRACTISRDVQNFDLLIEDMESLLGDAWGDLGFEEGVCFLAEDASKALDFIVLVIDAFDEDEVDQLEEVLAAARAAGVPVVTVAEDVTPATLGRLGRAGAGECLAYPLAEGALEAAAERLGRVSRETA